MRNWLPFEEARDFVRSQQLKTYKDWAVWAKSGRRPSNIPSSPPQVYKEEWVDYNDWFGTQRTSTREQHKNFLPFEEARQFSRGLGLISYDAWAVWSKTDERPAEIPTNPNISYKGKGWIDYADWLEIAKHSFKKFAEARAFVMGIGIRTETEFAKWASSDGRPSDVPSDPSRRYKNEGWQGWGHFLGTGNIASFEREFLSFDEARAITRSLHLYSPREWENWSVSDARPQDVPSNPSRSYRDEWKGWPDWLGYSAHEPVGERLIAAMLTKNDITFRREYKIEKCRDKSPLPFDFGVLDGEILLMLIEFQGEQHYDEKHQFHKENQRFAAAANRDRIKKEYCAANDIPLVVIPYGRANEITSILSTELTAVGIQRDWIDIHDWRNRGFTPFPFRSFAEARDFVHSLQLLNQKEWRQWSKTKVRPNDIPANPETAYAGKGWKNLSDWLGVDRRPRVQSCVDYQKAAEIARKSGITSSREYKKWADRPPYLPAHPDDFYRTTGWKNWPTFLGTGNIDWNAHQWRPFEKAREFARGLGFQSRKDWLSWSREGKKPVDIPAYPDQRYADEGWVNWHDWLDINRER